MRYRETTKLFGGVVAVIPRLGALRECVVIPNSKLWMYELILPTAYAGERRILVRKHISYMRISRSYYWISRDAGLSAG